MGAIRTLAPALLAVALSALPALAQAPSADEAARARLNAEQAEKARQQLEANAASRHAYIEAMAAREAALKAREETIARQAAETTRVQSDYEAAVKKWEADVAACKSGDRKRCAPVVKGKPAKPVA